MSEVSSSTHRRRFDDHPIHESLSQWISRIRSERPSNFRELPIESREALSRLRWVLREVRKRLAQTEPFLVQANVLSAINKSVRNLQGPWEQYLVDPKAQWQQLDNHTESLLGHIEKLGQYGQIGTWHETFDDLRSEMSRAIDDAKEIVTSTQASESSTRQGLGELAKEIQSQKGRLDKALTQHSEAFTSAEQDRAAQYSQSEQSRIDRFNDAQQTRKEEFERALADWIEKAGEVLKTEHGLLEQANASARDDSKTLLDDLQRQLDSAVEIVGTIVKTTMSGNYQIVANREYRNAWIMRGIAIAAFLAMGCMIIWAASSINFGESGVDWTTVAFRISLGIAFLIPGLYCAHESSRHWAAENRNRRISLELAALDPFLLKLDESKRKEIIERMAAEYFGNGVRSDDDKEVQTLKEISIRGDQLLKIVEQLAAAVRGK